MSSIEVRTYLHNDFAYYEVIAVIYFENVHVPCVHSSLVCIFATEMALYNTCDVSPLSKDGSLHRMLTLDTETSEYADINSWGGEAKGNKQIICNVLQS